MANQTSASQAYENHSFTIETSSSQTSVRQTCDKSNVWIIKPVAIQMSASPPVTNHSFTIETSAIQMSASQTYAKLYILFIDHLVL